MRSDVLRSATSATRLTAAMISDVLARTVTFGWMPIRWRTFGNSPSSRRVVISRTPLVPSPAKPIRPSPASPADRLSVTSRPAVIDFAVSASTRAGTSAAPSALRDPGSRRAP